MTPADFMAFVKEKAEKAGLSMDRVFLGGDHLGPLTFASLPEKKLWKRHVNLFVAM